ncbi:MAG: hypothetical protein R3336_06975 [Phycisphaeraceae bacterium]|nr:hypothetical protein [Phycisphaeraceae bacterium]
MRWKLAILVVAAGLCAGLLLHWRQRQIALQSELVTLHRQAAQHHQEIWRWQSRANRATETNSLHEELTRPEIAYEPARPASDPPLPVTAQR